MQIKVSGTHHGIVLFGKKIRNMEAKEMTKYFKSELTLSNPKKVTTLCKKNGVCSLDDLVTLSNDELEELLTSFKDNGIVVGDRSKMRKIKKQDIINYRVHAPELRGSESDSDGGKSPPLAPKQEKNSTGKEAARQDRPMITPPRPGVVGTLQGAPAWWRAHDVKMRKLAIASEAASLGVKVYSWQNVKPREKYIQGLWIRRAEILKIGLNSTPAMKEEWLALTYALDDSVSRGTEDKEASAEAKATRTYTWQRDVPDSGYAGILLQRRKEMLKLNLTDSSELQVEWVMLVRELEKLAYRTPISPVKISKTRKGSKSIDDADSVDSLDQPVNAKQPHVSKILFKDKPDLHRNKSRSVDRVTSLASFYSEAASEDLTCEETWYSQNDGTDVDEVGVHQTESMPDAIGSSTDDMKESADEREAASSGDETVILKPQSALSQDIE
eukprot:m.71518 g.71518  ORF g.71518 m.71518 type:complete len:442 (+) comp12251_c0_seq1:182-1507(+)